MSVLFLKFKVSKNVILINCRFNSFIVQDWFWIILNKKKAFTLNSARNNFISNV